MSLLLNVPQRRVTLDYDIKGVVDSMNVQMGEHGVNNNAQGSAADLRCFSSALVHRCAC
jgi:hypothetical protein